MEQWTLKSLEFNRVKEIVKEQAATVLGKEKIDHLQPTAVREEVERRLAETSEGMDLLRLKGDVPFGGIRDIRTAIRRAKMGGILNEAECLDIATTISGGRKVKSHLRQLEVETAALPRLRELTEQIESLDQLEEEIFACIDEHAVVKDQASTELRRIRQQMDAVRQQIQQTLNQMLRSSHYTKMMQEPLITQRFDRYVIPVKQEYRGQFGGIVHDQSSSGATLFIEPEAVVQLGNRLRELELSEEREVERILSLLTGKVQVMAEELSRNIALLAELDFIVARARYGYRVKGVCPAIAEDRVLMLKQARHPLIPREEVVPIDVEMGKRYRAVIITGPNTGGKTVTLKTIGLLALMTQSGLPIPAQEESVMPIFSGVFADIGDEQSIEQSLSTFSGHLTNIIQILQHLDEASLVLFDELGAGTDPTEGAALAMAILEHVIELGSMVVATTHYSELKLFAHTHPQAINASVEFDVETLRPTYRLLIGVPGRSNAFAISSRLGLPASIIETAKQHISIEENKLEEMIASLTTERKWAEEERKQAESLRHEAEELARDLRRQLDEWEEEKRHVKDKARREARDIVAKAQREAEEVLKELREWAKLRPQELKEHQLIEAKKRLDASIPEMELSKKTATRSAKPQKIKVGDEVLVLTVNQKGSVVEDLGNHEYQVQIGFLKMKVHRDQLEKQAESNQKQMPKSHSTVKRSTSDVKPELDLRGKLVEEALMEIDQYLDKAILAGYKQISLIHGKGTGALRTGVQEFLRRHRSVKSYRLGAHGEGGSGVTVVELR
ncbi:endonuclease MutS2 [Laceyella putida]|uniref:Endonuclease MutS2 n=1 Tax=Laceyella putida TaxID=110101 RepID=A0ABW2RPV1_9BACL